MDKPPEIFDRDVEWTALAGFAGDAEQGATLGIVSGRRRQGKTYLLDALCQQSGGFFFGATEATEADSLRRISAALTAYLDAGIPLRAANWHEVVDVLLAIGRERPVAVVLDEFPNLARTSPELPSIIQNAFGPLRDERLRSRSRLLLCGSALSFMGKLLSGGAPLRGRAGMELVVRTLDHRLAAEFWGISDPVLAVQVNAILGGTPAYRREFARNDSPKGRSDFDDWVIRTVLSPESPLFREARYLLAEEPDIRDTALYNSVLAAIADGNTTRGGISSYLGRKVSDLAHPLNVLEDCGFITRQQDLFRGNRASYRVAEPLITFYQAVMRPAWDQLERSGNAARVWRRSQQRFSSNVLGPRFEQLCREWTFYRAGDDLVDGLPGLVGNGTVTDAANQTSHEVDVAVVGVADRGRPPLLAVGEAKWGATLNVSHLKRLQRVRTLVASSGRYDTSDTRLICYSAAGFSEDLRAAERAGQVKLVGVERLYQ